RSPMLDPDMPLLEAFLSRAQGADVRLTMVDGRIVYQEGQFPHLNLSEVEQDAVRSACVARRPKDPTDWHRTAELRTQLYSHYQSVTAKGRGRTVDERRLGGADPWRSNQIHGRLSRCRPNTKNSRLHRVSH